MTSTSVDFSVDAPKPWAIRPRATGTCAENECRSRYPARRRYAQQPYSLRTAHARGKYGSEIYAAASYGSMGILEKNKPHAPSPRATLLDAGEKAATCLAPLVRTSNASPPAFPEGLPRLLILESFRWHSSRAARERATVLV